MLSFKIVDLCANLSDHRPIVVKIRYRRCDAQSVTTGRDEQGPEKHGYSYAAEIEVGSCRFGLLSFVNWCQSKPNI